MRPLFIYLICDLVWLLLYYAILLITFCSTSCEKNAVRVAPHKWSVFFCLAANFGNMSATCWQQVGIMSATCRQQGKMSPIFVPTGQFWRHGLQCVGTLCVTISQHCRTKYRQHMYVGKYIDESILSNSQRISTCLLSSALSAHTKFCICTLP